MKTGIKSPDKLTAYIERAYQKCIKDQERDFMEQTLLKITKACKTRGTLFTRDWDTLPLPLLQREGNLNELNDLGPQYEMHNQRLET